MKTLTLRNHNVMVLHQQRPPAHSCLFGSEFLSVDAQGKVMILSVPVLPLKEASHSKCRRASDTMMLNCYKQKSCNLKTPCKDYKELIQDKSSPELIIYGAQCETNVALATSKSNIQQEEKLDQVETIPESPLLKKTLSNEGDCVGETLGCLDIKAPSSQTNECNNNSETSPRLTTIIHSGIVPESPINDVEVISAIKLCAKLLPEPSSPNKDRTAIEGGCTSISPAMETNSPLENLPRNSCSRDWLLSSEDKSESVKQVRKFKRLRKVGDMDKNLSPECDKEKLLNPIGRTFSDRSPNQMCHGKGKRKQTHNIRAFIEEEAEVSSGAEISDDEEDDQGNSSYDDSFIDDRTNPTAASTPAETSRFDMMAIYRRSLLTQSPVQRESNSYITVTPDRGTSTSKSSSVKTPYSFPTPHNKSENKFAERYPDTFQMNVDRISAARPCVTTNFPAENGTMPERRRKLSFCQSRPIPAINLEQEFSALSDAARKESLQQVPAENCATNGEVFHDDEFFASLDLDAVEAQATLLLKNRSKLLVQAWDAIPKPNIQNCDLQSSPSFDLGI